MLVQNNQHGTMEATAIRAPGFGHRRIAYLEDLAAFTGGQRHHARGRPDARGRPARDARPRAARHRHARATRRSSRARAPRTRSRAGSTRSASSSSARRTTRDIDALRERLARLSSRLAVIRVGGATAIESKERLRRTEGSLAAARAAMSEGIVPGGGTALLRAEPALDGVSADGDRGAGIDVVRQRARRPAVLDRVERRLRRAGGRRPGAGDARRPRPQRADRRRSATSSRRASSTRCGSRA